MSGQNTVHVSLLGCFFVDYNLLTAVSEVLVSLDRLADRNEKLQVAQLK